MEQQRVREQNSGKRENEKREGDEQQHDGDGIPCPSCGAANTAEAAFCAECGAALAAAPCPKCGKPTTPGADICEFCGAWLLAGKCVYCYAPLPEGAAFCPECGLPQDGIECPTCHTRSRFDFCSTCNAPLTQAARTLAAQAASDPVVAALRTAILRPAAAPSGQSGTGSPADATGTAQRPRRRGLSAALKQELTGVPASPQESPQTVADAGAAAFIATTREREREEEQRIRRENIRKLKEKEMKMRFPSHQSARTFYMAEKPANAIGWQCNWCNFFHPVADGGPNDCHMPSLGGYWVIEE